MQRVFEHRRITASLILSLTDSYAASRRGPHSLPRPYEPIQIFLVARQLPNPLIYDPPPELALIRNPSGYHLFFGEALLPDNQRRHVPARHRATRRLDLSPGQYLIRITSPFYQTEERTVVVPLPNLNLRDPGNPDPTLRDPLAQYTVNLRPSYAYPFPDRYVLRVDDPDSCPDPPPIRTGPTLLSGGVSSTAGSGLSGVRVEVPGITDSYLTDTNGQWIVWFPDPPPGDPDPLAGGLVTVRYRLPGPPAEIVDVPNVCVLRGASTSLSQAALRGRVMRRGVGVTQASISISGQPQPVSTSADGSWVYYFGLNQADSSVDVIATLPDGSSQTQPGIMVRKRATVVVPSFIFL